MDATVKKMALLSYTDIIPHHLNCAFVSSSKISLILLKYCLYFLIMNLIAYLNWSCTFKSRELTYFDMRNNTMHICITTDEIRCFFTRYIYHFFTNPQI